MRLSALTMILLAYFPLFAQEGFVDGFIIPVADDTVKVLVKEDFRGQTIEVIENGERHAYHPKEILGFGIGKNRRYLSYQDQEFLSITLLGQVSLLTDGKRYFASKRNEIVELKVETTRRLVEGETKIIKLPVWQNTLESYFSDCPIHITPSTRLTSKNLINLVSDYHQCLSLDYTIFAPEKRQLNLGGEIGVSFVSTQVDVSNNDPTGLNPYAADEYNSEDLSVRLHGVLRWSKRGDLSPLAFVTGLTMISSDFAGQQIVTIWEDFGTERPPGYYTVYHSQFSYSQIKLPLAMRYYFLDDSFSIYAQAGLSLAFVFDQQSVITGDIYENGAEVLNVDRPPFNLDSQLVGGEVAIGITKNLRRWSIALIADYTRLSGAFDVNTFEAAYGQFGVGLQVGFH